MARQLVIAVLLLQVTAITHAQTARSAQPDISVPCASDLTPSRSCLSFKELIDARDDIRNTVATADEAFVCFEPQEDRFFVVDFELPQHFWVVKSPLIEEQVGSIRWLDFDNGSPSGFHVAFGRWTKPREGNDLDPTFVGESPFRNKGTKRPQDSTKAFIEATDLTMSYTFQNRGGTQTLLELGIRRSTGRFIESFSWREPGRGAQQNDVAGRCFHYRQGLLISQQ